MTATAAAAADVPADLAVVQPLDPVVSDHADRIVPDLEGLRDTQIQTRDRVGAVWERVKGDEVIRKDFDGAQIRAVTMCGRVANRVMELLGDSPDFIRVMSIGDVDLPAFIEPAIRDIYERAHAYHMEMLAKTGTCYDLASQGAEEARGEMIRYFDSHYGFSDVPGLSQKLMKNSTITNGGMRALDDIVTGLIKRTQDRRALRVEGEVSHPQDRRRNIDRRQRRVLDGSAPLNRTRPAFIYPDNSFGTWKAIVNLRGQGGKVADLHELQTSQENRLHLTADDVHAFYDANFRDDKGCNAEGALMQDTWYITPVGNPSGTKSTHLLETCSTIIERNPRAIIILDSVYVRTLSPEVARDLYAEVLQNPLLLDRIIIVESFSKTHGLCGERIGTYMSANSELFGTIQNVNMTLSAGNGHYRSAMVRALCNTSNDQEQAVCGLHEFWAEERRGLHQYLLGDGKFPHLFDQDQSHITEDDLQTTLGLYLFVKLQPGVGEKEVLSETGCLGTETPMKSGRYMRFSVGKITSPTFASTH